jgi:hypothetical protein
MLGRNAGEDRPVRKSSRRQAIPEEKKGFPVWLIGLLGAGTGILAGAIILAVLIAGAGEKDDPEDGPVYGGADDGASSVSSKRKAGRRKPPRRPRPPRTGKDPAEDDESDAWGEEEDLSPREAFDRAKRYLEEHPGEYDRAIGRLNVILRRYQDLFREEVTREIEKVTSRRDAEAEKEYKTLEARLRAHLEAGRYQKAHEEARSFPERFFGSPSYENAQTLAKTVVEKALEKFRLAEKKAEELAEAGYFDDAFAVLRETFAFGIREVKDAANRMISRLQRRKEREQKAREREKAEKRQEQAAAGEKLWTDFLPVLAPLLKRREYTEAEKRLREKIRTTRNTHFADLLSEETQNLLKLRKVFPLARGALGRMEGQRKTFHIRGKPFSGTLSRTPGGGWVLRSGATTIGLNVETLSASDIEELLRGEELGEEEHLSLGLFLLAEEKPEAARKALERSGCMTERLRSRLLALEQSALAGRVKAALGEAEDRLDKKEWAKAREKVEKLLSDFGEKLSPEQRERAEEIRVECNTEESGIRERFAGRAWLLDEERIRLLYRFEDAAELRDWTAGADKKAGVFLGRLELEKRTVLWSRFRIVPPFRCAFDVEGDEVDLNLGGTKGEDWKDGYHLVVGRGGRAILHKAGNRVADWRCSFPRGRTCRVEVKLDDEGVLSLTVEGSEVFQSRAKDPAAFGGRLGLWGHPGKNLYDNLEIAGKILPAEGGPEAGRPRPLPRGPVRLFTGSLDEEWKIWRGKWNADERTREIHGDGRNAALLAVSLEKYRFTDYEFRVEVRLVPGRESRPGLIFPFGGKYPTWSFGPDGGKIDGLPESTAIPHELGKKWNLLRIVCRNGKVEGYIGKRRCWAATNPAASFSPLSKCPPGLGLIIGRGQGLFRNPSIYNLAK